MTDFQVRLSRDSRICSLEECVVVQRRPAIDFDVPQPLVAGSGNRSDDSNLVSLQRTGVLIKRLLEKQVSPDFHIIAAISITGTCLDVLRRLVSEIMKVTDPVRYDELADEIWQVLAERERLAADEGVSSEKERRSVA